MHRNLILETQQEPNIRNAQEPNIRNNQTPFTYDHRSPFTYARQGQTPDTIHIEVHQHIR